MNAMLNLYNRSGMSPVARRLDRLLAMIIASVAWVSATMV